MSNAKEQDPAEARRRIEDLMHAIVAGSTDPYEAGWEIWSVSFGTAPKSTELFWPMWLLWGALTDWVEVKPEKTEEAYKAMGRAAAEWLELPDEDAARVDYFERWLYDEMGYERKQPT